jgi:hypothetical protein
VKRASAVLPALFQLAMDIDALDDVARGFSEPNDRRRVEAARKALSTGMAPVLEGLEHCVRLARTAIGGADSEWAIFDFAGGIGDFSRELSATTARARSKLGKRPSAARRAAGARAWKNRNLAEWAAEADRRAA